jgi:enoyl-CoA hydratase
MIRVEERGPVSLLTIDRPERRNAVDHDTLEQLHSAVEAASGARAIVLSGAGDHFCAGADLKGVEDASFAVVLRRALAALRSSPAATIAAVQGAALGAGTQLAVVCDLRVATGDARFGIPAAKLGLMVDQWTVQRVAMLAGQGPASAMLLAAETVSGDEARALGLVQRVGSLEDALAWAEDIAALAPLTIQGHKLALNRLEPLLEDDPDFAHAFERAWGSRDLQEGLSAFREGRRPLFRGR